MTYILLGGFEKNPNVSSRHVCSWTLGSTSRKESTILEPRSTTFSGFQLVTSQPALQYHTVEFVREGKLFFFLFFGSVGLLRHPPSLFFLSVQGLIPSSILSYFNKVLTFLKFLFKYWGKNIFLFFILSNFLVWMIQYFY